MLLEKIKEDFFRDITALGGALFYFIVIIAFYLLGQKKIAIGLIAGFVIIYLITIIIRLLYFKDRPKKEKYKTIAEQIDASAFPSVHSARATYLAITITQQYSTLTADIFFILIFATVCYSRIHLKKHDWKDVTAGVILGIMAFALTSNF